LSTLAEGQLHPRGSTLITRPADGHPVEWRFGDPVNEATLAFFVFDQFGLCRDPVIALEAVRPTLFLPHFIGTPANAAFSIQHRRQLIIFGCKLRDGFDRSPVINACNQPSIPLRFPPQFARALHYTPRKIPTPHSIYTGVLQQRWSAGKVAAIWQN